MSQETKILAGIGILMVVLIIAGALILGGTQTNQKVNQNLLERSDSNKISTTSAKLTLVEFGDFQCPACKTADLMVKQLMEDEKGKLNFVFRNFAFLGPESIWAAEASECAAKEGKYWEYHHYLYENQGAENSGVFSKDNLKRYARVLKLDALRFNICLDRGKYSQKVADDRADAASLGVNSTPTFFLDGEKVVGASTLREKVEERLK